MRILPIYMTQEHFQNITNAHYTRMFPKYYWTLIPENYQKNYQDIQYTPEITCGALYVILLNCGSSFVGVELYYNKVDRVYLPELLLTELSWELKIRGKNGY